MPELSRVRAVFFDAVGTLIHPTPSAPEVYAAVAARHGLALDPAEVRRRFVAAFRAEEEVDRAAGWVTSEAREEGRWRRIVARTLPVADGEACFRELYDHYARPEAWAVDPAAGAVFAALRGRGLTLGLASNYDRRLEAVADGHPALRGLRPNLVVSSQVGWRKPGGGFFAAVRRVAQAEAHEIALVGDDVENDVLGAAAAGLHAVLLDPHGRNPQAKSRVTTLLELLPRFGA